MVAFIIFFHLILNVTKPAIELKNKRTLLWTVITRDNRSTVTGARLCKRFSKLYLTFHDSMANFTKACTHLKTTTNLVIDYDFNLQNQCRYIKCALSENQKLCAKLTYRPTYVGLFYDSG